jgi:predicted MFS family arabinose efflux permease
MSDEAADRRMLALLSLACFAAMTSMRVCDALLPALAAEFAVTTGQAASVVSAFAVAYGVSQLFFGPMGDRFGKFKVVSFAVLACTAGSALAAAATSLQWLTTCRLLSGAAAAGIIPLSMAWVGDSVGYDRRQEVLARLLGATVFGMIAGQSAGGLLVPALGEPRLVLLGGASLAVSFAGLAVVPNWALSLPACLLAGFGFYAMHNTLQTHATQMAPSARGTAVSLFSCCLFLGQSLGLVAAALVVDRWSTSAVFLASSIGLLTLAVLFASMLRRRAVHPEVSSVAPISS